MVFVEGLNDALALATWFEKRVSRRFSGAGMLRTAGVRFIPAGGKRWIASWMRIAGRYGLKALGLYDADVLGTKDRKAHQEIVKEWQTWKLVDPSIGITLGDPSNIQTVSERSGGRIFFCGLSLDDKFENLPVFELHLKEAEAQVGEGPLAYRWVAEHYDYHEGYDPSHPYSSEESHVFDQLFQRIIELTA